MEQTQQTEVAEIKIDSTNLEQADFETRMKIYTDKYAERIHKYYPEISNSISTSFLAIKKTFGSMIFEFFLKYVLSDALIALRKVVKEQESENLNINSEAFKSMLKKQIIRDISLKSYSKFI